MISPCGFSMEQGMDPKWLKSPCCFSFLRFHSILTPRRAGSLLAIASGFVVVYRLIAAKRIED